MVEVAKRDLDAAVDGGLAVLEEVEGGGGVVVEGENLVLESFRFVEKVLFKGGEVVGEFLPEEGAAGHEGGLALEVVEAGRRSKLANLAGIGGGRHGGGGEKRRRNPSWLNLGMEEEREKP